MGVPRVSVRSQRTKRASSRLRAARAKAAHYICHHGLADFASWHRLFRESEKNSLFAAELDNLWGVSSGYISSDKFGALPVISTVNNPMRLF